MQPGKHNNLNPTSSGPPGTPDPTPTPTPMISNPPTSSSSSSSCSLRQKLSARLGAPSFSARLIRNKRILALISSSSSHNRRNHKQNITPDDDESEETVRVPRPLAELTGLHELADLHRPRLPSTTQLHPRSKRTALVRKHPFSSSPSLSSTPKSANSNNIYNSIDNHISRLVPTVPPPFRPRRRVLRVHAVPPEGLQYMMQQAFHGYSRGKGVVEIYQTRIVHYSIRIPVDEEFLDQDQLHKEPHDKSAAQSLSKAARKRAPVTVLTATTTTTTVAGGEINTMTTTTTTMTPIPATDLVAHKRNLERIQTPTSALDPNLRSVTPGVLSVSGSPDFYSARPPSPLFEDLYEVLSGGSPRPDSPFLGAFGASNPFDISAANGTSNINTSLFFAAPGTPTSPVDMSVDYSLQLGQLLDSIHVSPYSLVYDPAQNLSPISSPQISHLSIEVQSPRSLLAPASSSTLSPPSLIPLSLSETAGEKACQQQLPLSFSSLSLSTIQPDSRLAELPLSQSILHSDVSKLTIPEVTRAHLQELQKRGPKRDEEGKSQQQRKEPFIGPIPEIKQEPFSPSSQNGSKSPGLDFTNIDDKKPVELMSQLLANNSPVQITNSYQLLPPMSVQHAHTFYSEPVAPISAEPRLSGVSAPFSGHFGSACASISSCAVETPAAAESGKTPQKASFHETSQPCDASSFVTARADSLASKQLNSNTPDQPFLCEPQVVSTAGEVAAEVTAAEATAAATAKETDAGTKSAAAFSPTPPQTASQDASTQLSDCRPWPSAVAWPGSNKSGLISPQLSKFLTPQSSTSSNHQQLPALLPTSTQPSSHLESKVHPSTLAAHLSLHMAFPQHHHQQQQQQQQPPSNTINISTTTVNNNNHHIIPPQQYTFDFGPASSITVSSGINSSIHPSFASSISQQIHAQSHAHWLASPNMDHPAFKLDSFKLDDSTDSAVIAAASASAASAAAAAVAAAANMYTYKPDPLHAVYSLPQVTAPARSPRIIPQPQPPVMERPPTAPLLVSSSSSTTVSTPLVGPMPAVPMSSRATSSMSDGCHSSGNNNNGDHNDSNLLVTGPPTVAPMATPPHAPTSISGSLQEPGMASMAAGASPFYQFQGYPSPAGSQNSGMVYSMRQSTLFPVQMSSQQPQHQQQQKQQQLQKLPPVQSFYEPQQQISQIPQLNQHNQHPQLPPLVVNNQQHPFSFQQQQQSQPQQPSQQPQHNYLQPPPQQNNPQFEIYEESSGRNDSDPFPQNGKVVHVHNHRLPQPFQVLSSSAIRRSPAQPVSCSTPSSPSVSATCRNSSIATSLSSKKLKERPWTNPLIKNRAATHVNLMQSNIDRLIKAKGGKKGKYYCTHCDTKYSTILELCAHMDAVGTTRPYHCQEEECPWFVCGFPTASECSRHSKSQHGRQAMLECPTCDKKFARKDSLKRHKQLVHDNKDSRYNKKRRTSSVIGADFSQ